MSTYGMRVRLVGENEGSGRFKSLWSDTERRALTYLTISAENVVNEDKRDVGNFLVDIFLQSEKLRPVASFLILKENQGCITHRPRCHCGTCTLAYGETSLVSH